MFMQGSPPSVQADQNRHVLSLIRGNFVRNTIMVITKTQNTILTGQNPLYLHNSNDKPFRGRRKIKIMYIININHL